MRAYPLKILMFLVLSLLVAGTAHAQLENIDMDKIENIPSYAAAELSEENFLAQSKLYEEEPLGDQFLAYKLRLPRGWHKAETDMSFNQKEMEKAGVSQHILGQVAKYYGPGRIESLSSFEIEAQGLDFDVTAKNWFMQEILTQGYALEGLKVYSDKRVEALYVVVKGDTAFVVRAVAEINGSRMVVASYYIPDKFWTQERAYQERAMESFQFISPEKSKIERLRTYSFLDLLTFDYPASWRLIAPNIFSVQGMEAQLILSSDQVTMNGEMHISVISTEFETALTEELAYLKNEMVDRGLEIGAIIETPDKYKFNDHIYYGYVEVHKAVDDTNQVLEHEYWIAIMEEDRYYYVVTMLTPGREGDFYTWARNAESFQTVLQSFRL